MRIIHSGNSRLQTFLLCPPPCFFFLNEAEYFASKNSKLDDRSSCGMHAAVRRRLWVRFGPGNKRCAPCFFLSPHLSVWSHGWERIHEDHLEGIPISITGFFPLCGSVVRWKEFFFKFESLWEMPAQLTRLFACAVRPKAVFNRCRIMGHTSRPCYPDQVSLTHFKHLCLYLHELVSFSIPWPCGF